MATRDDVYGTFGSKLIEALVLLLVQEINITRKGKDPLDAQDVLDTLAQANDLPDYTWMD